MTNNFLCIRDNEIQQNDLQLVVYNEVPILNEGVGNNDNVNISSSFFTFFILLYMIMFLCLCIMRCFSY